MSNIIAIVEELKKNVEYRYTLNSHTPNGFEETAFDIKLTILSDLFEEDEKIGLCNKDSDGEKAYIQLAELYKACGSWN